MKQSTKIILVILLVALFVVPFIIQKDAEFGGADGAAADQIESQNPDYEPWFSNIYEPASGEIESFLFAFQAAIGAIVIGYYFGYNRGRRTGKKEK